jgi:hypothetical protein
MRFLFLKMFDNKKNETVDGLKLPVSKYKDTDEWAAAMKLVCDYICVLMELGEDPRHSLEFINILTVPKFLLLGKDLGVKLEKYRERQWKNQQRTWKN